MNIAKTFLDAGFAATKSEPRDGGTMHGYQHADGRVAVHSVPDDRKQPQTWAVVAGKESRRGTASDSKELKAALRLPASNVRPPERTVAAVVMLRRASHGTYALTALKGESGYGERVAIIKRLTGKRRLLVAEATFGKLRTALLAATGAKDDAALPTACKSVLAAEKAANQRLEAAQAAIAEQLLLHAEPEPEPDAAPKLAPPAPPSTAEDRRKQLEDLRAEIAERAEKHKEYPTATLHSADVELIVDPQDLCLLEDPRNGVVLLKIEKNNSQGAICVYNNGRRVAAGVATPDTLKICKRLEGDVFQAARQLMAPLSAAIEVTPTAARHLTAVLNCKEKEIMANTEKKAKKFESPKAAVKAVKAAAPAKSAAKASKAKGEATGGSRLDEAQKIKILTKDNPYREGTKSFTTYALLLKSKTVGEFVTALDKAKDDVYGAAHFLNYASAPRGAQPAHIELQ